MCRIMSGRWLGGIRRARGLVQRLSAKCGRKRGGKPGTPLSARTVQLTLVHFQRACDDAVEERLMSVNPCRRVKRPKTAPPEHELWSDEETGKFEAVVIRGPASSGNYLAVPRTTA